MNTETDKVPYEKVVNNNPLTGRRTGTYARYHWKLVQQPKFERRCGGLKGNIFDCADSRQANKFNITM